MAGKQGNIWYFGNKVGLDFNNIPTGGYPSVLTDGIINTREGVATIANAAGELLFYTDGIDVMSAPSGGGLHEVLTYSTDYTKSRIYVGNDIAAGEYQGNYWDYHPTLRLVPHSNGEQYLYSDTASFDDDGAGWNGYTKSTGLFGDWSSTQSGVIVPIPLSDIDIKDYGWREPYKYVIFTVPAKHGTFFQKGHNGGGAKSYNTWCDLSNSYDYGLGVNPNNPLTVANTAAKGVSYTNKTDTKRKKYSYCRGKRNSQHGVLHYTIIDLRYNTAGDIENASFDASPLNGKPRGVGVIVERNRPVGYKTSVSTSGVESTESEIQFKTVAEKIAATQTDDKKGIWVTTRLAGSNGIQITKVTSSGVQQNALNKAHDDGVPVKTIPASNHKDAVGYMRFSSDGARLAMLRMDGNIIVSHFNNLTGTISNTKVINTSHTDTGNNHDKFTSLKPYGLEITYDPNATNGDGSTGDYIYYVQVMSNSDYNKRSIIGIRDDVFSSTTTNWISKNTYGSPNDEPNGLQSSTELAVGFKAIRGGGSGSVGGETGLQMGSDGLIYVSIDQEWDSNNKISVISASTSWASVAYGHEVLDVSSAGAGGMSHGLPTFMSSFFNACASFYLLVTDDSDATTFGASDGTAEVTAYGTTGTTNYKWFDGVLPANEIGVTTNTATILSAGTYTISGNTILDGETCTSTTSIIIDGPHVYGSSTYQLCEDGCDLEFGSSTGGGVYFTALTTNNEVLDCIKVYSGILSDPMPSKELTAGCCEIDACDKMIEFKFSCVEVPVDPEDPKDPTTPITCFIECENQEMYDYTYGGTDLTRTTGPSDRNDAIEIIEKLLESKTYSTNDQDLISLEFVKHFNTLDITAEVMKYWDKIFVDPFVKTDEDSWVIGCDLCPPQCGYYFIGGYSPYVTLPLTPNCSISSQGYNHDSLCGGNGVFYGTGVVDINESYPADKIPTSASDVSLFTCHGIFEQNADYSDPQKPEKILDFSQFDTAKCAVMLQEGIVFFSNSNGCLCAAKTSNYIKIHNIVNQT